ncbi:hypothetical protein [Escherichia coli]|uniref:hypothetical protein n=1 Tax=Escherichia coli TaxID=562 RepID=UPI000CFB73BA|nr:hypothetical protein [Escherichia coli]
MTFILATRNRYLEYGLQVLLKGLQDINNVVRSGLWARNTTVRTLTMSEMAVMFGYVYRELKPLQLAKNGMQALNARHLVCGVK